MPVSHITNLCNRRLGAVGFSYKDQPRLVVIVKRNAGSIGDAACDSAVIPDLNTVLCGELQGAPMTLEQYAYLAEMVERMMKEVPYIDFREKLEAVK